MGFLDGVKEKVGGAGDFLAKKGSDVASDVGGAVDSADDVVDDTVGGAVESVTSAPGDAVNIADDAVEGAAESVSNVADAGFESLPDKTASDLQETFDEGGLDEKVGAAITAGGAVALENTGASDFIRDTVEESEKFDAGNVEESIQEGGAIEKLDTAITVASSEATDAVKPAGKEVLETTAEVANPNLDVGELEDGEIGEAVAAGLDATAGRAEDAVVEATDDTALDNKVTAGIAGFTKEAFVKDPYKGLVKASTGIDPETGEENAKISSFEAFDAATLGGSAAFKGGAKAAPKVGKLLRGGSKATKASGRATKAGAQAAKAATKTGAKKSTMALGGIFKIGSKVADELPSGLRGLRSGVDDAGSGFRSVDDAVRGDLGGLDDLGVSTRSIDDAGSGIDDFGSGIDEQVSPIYSGRFSGSGGLDEGVGGVDGNVGGFASVDDVGSVSRGDDMFTRVSADAGTGVDDVGGVSGVDDIGGAGGIDDVGGVSGGVDDFTRITGRDAAAIPDGDLARLGRKDLARIPNEDLARLGDEDVGRILDDGSVQGLRAAGDDFGEAGARFGDDVGDARRLGDEGDDLVSRSLADENSGLFGSTTGKVLGGGALLGGGAALGAAGLAALGGGGEGPGDQPDGQPPGNNQDPGWGEPQQVDQVKGWTVWAQEHQDGRVRLWAVRGGGSVYLQPGGEEGPNQHYFESEDALVRALEQWARKQQEQQDEQSQQEQQRQQNRQQQGGSGGQGWGPEEQIDQADGWTFYGQAHPDGRKRFWGVRDGGSVFLQPGGEEGSSQHYFQSKEALTAAFEKWKKNQNGEGGSDGGSGGQDGDDESSENSEWSEPKKIDKVEGWKIYGQTHPDGRTRFFAVGKNNDGQKIYLQPGGQVKTEIHYFDTKEKLVASIEEWVRRRNNGETSPGEEPTGEEPRNPEDSRGGWSEMQYVQELQFGWHLYGQSHPQQGERLIIAGKHEGDRIYLDKDGGVVDLPVTYRSADGVASALESYSRRLRNGNVDRQPNGQRPDASAVEDDMSKEPSDGGFLSSLSTEQKLLGGAAIAVGGYYAYEQGYFDDILEEDPTKATGGA